ncbi:hypothetical protein GCM10009792_15690 [Microcella alkalica]|uniref:Uncharacterized protein n=1 Tax=Microcella alkalica TaxID=355930 RepID=A0A839E8D2_9MICO|nr:hypothetical protein [Microcella alkalica]MBA8848899.1 hypothetical protein [Microcella alkalica]
MSFTNSLDTARLVRVAASLGLDSDPDFDLAAHPVMLVPRVHSPYFAEWEFDLPTRGSGYFDDEAAAPVQAAIAS